MKGRCPSRPLHHLSPLPIHYCRMLFIAVFISHYLLVRTNQVNRKKAGKRGSEAAEGSESRITKGTEQARKRDVLISLTLGASSVPSSKFLEACTQIPALEGPTATCTWWIRHLASTGQLPSGRGDSRPVSATVSRSLPRAWARA